MNTLFVLLQEAQQPKGGMFGSLLPLLLIMVVFVFFFILPQRKKAKETQKFRDELKKGDKVVTVGGIYGTILEVNDNKVMLEIDKDVKIKVDKASLVKDFSEAQQA